MMLETERLVLRNWRESDVDHYLVLAGAVGYNCFSQPGRFLVHSAAEAQAKVRERLRLYDQRKLGKFPIFLKDSGEFIGTCGLEPYDLVPSQPVATNFSQPGSEAHRTSSHLDKIVGTALAGQSEVELGYRLCLKFGGKDMRKKQQPPSWAMASAN